LTPQCQFQAESNFPYDLKPSALVAGTSPDSCRCDSAMTARATTTSWT
jgi:hypothetical protein